MKTEEKKAVFVKVDPILWAKFKALSARKMMTIEEMMEKILSKIIHDSIGKEEQ